jgi:hypothetical protein
VLPSTCVSTRRTVLLGRSAHRYSYEAGLCSVHGGKRRVRMYSSLLLRTGSRVPHFRSQFPVNDTSAISFLASHAGVVGTTRIGAIVEVRRVPVEARRQLHPTFQLTF